EQVRAGLGDHIELDENGVALHVDAGPASGGAAPRAEATSAAGLAVQPHHAGDGKRAMGNDRRQHARRHPNRTGALVHGLCWIRREPWRARERAKAPAGSYVLHAPTASGVSAASSVRNWVLKRPAMNSGVSSTCWRSGTVGEVPSIAI